MEHVLGNVFICKDLDVARQVAFHERIRRKCVTLDGDVVDPAGVLSGGARKKETPILIQLNEMKQYEVNAIMNTCRAEFNNFKLLITGTVESKRTGT